MSVGHYREIQWQCFRLRIPERYSCPCGKHPWRCIEGTTPREHYFSLAIVGMFTLLTIDKDRLSEPDLGHGFCQKTAKNAAPNEGFSRQHYFLRFVG